MANFPTYDINSGIIAMEITIAASIIGVVGSLSGTLLGAWLQRDSKRMQVMERKVLRYQAEIKARQAVEQVTCAWLVEIGQFATKQGALRQLRNKTEETTGLRPSLAPSDLRD